MPTISSRLATALPRRSRRESPKPTLRLDGQMGEQGALLGHVADPPLLGRDV